MLPIFDYVRPQSVAGAVRELARPGALPLAGGTDLLGCLRDGAVPPGTVVSLNALAELRGISDLDGGIRIGALTPLAEVAEHILVRERYRALAQAAASVGSPQLRNQGTLGGNLCQRPRCWYFRGDFPCLRKGGDQCFAAEGENDFHAIFGGAGCYFVHPSDTASALVPLQAKFRLDGPGGARVVPADSFFVPPAKDPTKENVLAPGELITDVLLPRTPDNLRSSYRKVRTRGSWDFALAGVALALNFKNARVESARVVLAGVAPVPWRVTASENCLAGRHLDSRVAAQAANACIKGAEPLSKNRYKLDLVRGIVEEALLTFA